MTASPGGATGADAVNEGTLKPKAVVSYGPATVPVTTVAFWALCSRQLMDDSAAFAPYLDGEMRNGLDAKIDDEVVNDTGIAPHMTGLVGASTPWVPAADSIGLDSMIGRSSRCVHYGVCLSTIKTLGRPSAALDRIIADLDSLSSVAAILTTELGVACSHLAIATRADYDPASDDFVLATPDASACKLMANVALDGVAKTGVVFAQLWCGGRNHGLFPFVVPIRDRDRVFDGIHVKAVPGTSSMGLDYSIVSFSGVRVPRTHWLQDSATISADG